MKIEFRGQLKTKEIVDIIKFTKDVAVCTDGKKRNIDEFNTIFYSSKKFKEDILKMKDDEIEFKSEKAKRQSV